MLGDTSIATASLKRTFSTYEPPRSSPERPAFGTHAWARLRFPQAVSGNAITQSRSPSRRNPVALAHLGAAADPLGKGLVVNRQGNVIFFWAEDDGSASRRRGRPRRTSIATQ